MKSPPIAGPSPLLSLKPAQLHWASHWTRTCVSIQVHCTLGVFLLFNVVRNRLYQLVTCFLLFSPPDEERSQGKNKDDLDQQMPFQPPHSQIPGSDESKRIGHTALKVKCFIETLVPVSVHEWCEQGDGVGGGHTMEGGDLCAQVLSTFTSLHPVCHN